MEKGLNINFVELLRKSGCVFKAQINEYDGSHLLKGSSLSFDRNKRAESHRQFDNVSWQCSYEVALPVKGENVFDISVKFTLLKGRVPEGSVGVSFTFSQWAVDNYVLMPAAVYNGNRYECRPIPYPPKLTAPEDMGPDIPPIISDVPRLNIHPGLSRIQLLTRDMATPGAGIYLRQFRKGFFLLTEQGTPLGDSGIFIAESRDRSSATLCLMAPGVREEVQYTICNLSNPSQDRGADFREGDEVSIHFRVYLFDSPGIAGLFKRFSKIRKDISGPVKLYHGLPFSAACSILEEKYNRQNWNEEYGFYSVGVGERVNQKWQAGWVGGMMVTYPLLFEGTPESRQRALRNFEFLFAKGQARSGLLYGMGDGEHFYGDGYGMRAPDKNDHRTLVRRDGDGLYFMVKQFLLLQEQDTSWRIPAAWDEGTRSLADALVGIWRGYGQLGQFVDVETAKIMIGGSTAAGIVPAGLALAGCYFDNKEYLKVAEAVALQLYKRDVLAGITTGGPGEMLQCPDSESAFGLLESFVVLYEVTGNREWIERAEDMARQCATWCVSYDFKFPQDSLFGSLDMHTAGSVWANVQNKHSAPGICTLSGDSLFKLYRATGDLLYLELLREIAHNLTQYLSRADRLVGDLPPGWMNERVNLSDWEGKKKIGGIFHGSCWPEVSAMLTWVEVPGLYVQPDTGFVCALDHIEVKVVKNDNDHLVLRVTNPTSFKASVKVFSENSTGMSRPLGQNALLGCRRILLEPGGGVDAEFKKNSSSTLSRSLLLGKGRKGNE